MTDSAKWLDKPAYVFFSSWEKGREAAIKSASGKVYVSSLYFGQIAKRGNPFQGDFEHLYGFKIYATHLLPYRLRYKCSDVKTREECFVEGEEVHAVFLPDEKILNPHWKDDLGFTDWKYNPDFNYFKRLI